MRSVPAKIQPSVGGSLAVSRTEISLRRVRTARTDPVIWTKQTDGGAISVSPAPFRFVVTNNGNGYTLVDRRLLVEWSQIATLKEAQRIAEDLMGMAVEASDEP